MNRVKTIGLVASHIVFGLIGLLLATRGSGSGPESPQATSSVTKDRLDSPGLIERSSGPNRSPRSLKDWRGSEHMRAWNAVRQAKLNTKDRIQTQQELLKSWAMVDLAAAMQAALDEAWDNDEDNYYDPTGPLVDVFSEAFAQNREEAWDLIRNGGFGIGASMLRSVWIQSVGQKDPLYLASLIKDLSWRDRDQALNACIQGVWNSEIKETRAKLFDQLAALPADIVSAEQLAGFLTAGRGDLGVSTLREDLLHAKTPNDRIAMAKAVVMGRALGDKSIEEVASAIADLPGTLKQEVLWSNLDSGISRTGTELTGLLDLLVSENSWDKLEKREVAGMLLISSKEGDPRQVADWVATIPYRKETTEMFHRGVETYLRDNMDTSREWIASIPAQEWRDRAYAEYSQQALNAKKDPAASRWALDHIQDPAFKSEAEGWRGKWENRNAQKPK